MDWRITLQSVIHSKGGYKPLTPPNLITFIPSSRSLHCDSVAVSIATSNNLPNI